PFCYVAHDSLYTLSVLPLPSSFLSNHPSTTDIYTLSLHDALPISDVDGPHAADESGGRVGERRGRVEDGPRVLADVRREHGVDLDRKSTRLNSSHVSISYAVFCLKKKKKIIITKRWIH